MRKFCKQLYKGTKKFIEMIISIVSVLLFSSFKVNSDFKRLKRSLNSDSSIHILCNGPSLNNALLTYNLNCENLMVVNIFALTKEFELLKPRYYILLDPNLTKKSSISSPKRSDLIQRISEVSWPMFLLIPVNTSRDLIDIIKNNLNITIIKYNQTPISGFINLSHILYSYSLGMPYPYNVLNAAIFAAINIGFSRIYLYGAEHSWTKSFDVDESAHRIFLNDGHFYEKENKRYLEKGAFKLWLHWIYLMLDAHDKLSAYAVYRGVDVINRTPNSFIDSYRFE